MTEKKEPNNKVELIDCAVDRQITVKTEGTSSEAELLELADKQLKKMKEDK